MLCNKCGGLIPEKSIYCNHCGNKIIILPQYEDNHEFEDEDNDGFED